MNAELMSGKPPPEPPVRLFLKPSFGITVQSQTLTVRVSARPEGTPARRPPVHG